MKKLMTLFVLIGGLLVSGCAIKEADHVAVRTGAPVVHIYPMGAQYKQAAALVLPFQVPAGTQPSYGQQVGALFHEVFLSRQAFATLRRRR